MCRLSSRQTGTPCLPLCSMMAGCSSMQNYKGSLAMERRIYSAAAHSLFFHMLVNLQRPCIRARDFFSAKAHAKDAFECILRFRNVCDATYQAELQKAMRQADEVIRTRGEKEPCPCGSGQRYKRCAKGCWARRP